METTQITVRMDKELKEKAEILFKELGLNMTTAFNVFVSQAVREQRIPFELSMRNCIPNEETRRVLDSGRNEKDTVGPFYTIEALMESLNADD